MSHGCVDRCALCEAAEIVTRLTLEEAATDWGVTWACYEEQRELAANAATAREKKR
jgi:hypothetical protein